MLLYLSTWQEVEAYLQKSQGIIIPIGSTEQHGPTGLIGTDFICAETIAKGVGERTGAMVSSTLTIGMAEHHLGFPGTISLQPKTMMLLIYDVVRSLAKHGFRRLFFINGHGGNIAIVRATFSEIYNDFPEVRCRLANWWMGKNTSKLTRELYGDQEGAHATPSEVAVTMYAYPHAIKNVELTTPAPPDTGIFSPEDFRRRYPDGRMGSNPKLATIEHGQKLYETAVVELADYYLNFLKDDSGVEI
ncbi:MAG: creatininase family protein [Pseudanabaenaceae cyanobacterium]